MEDPAVSKFGELTYTSGSITYNLVPFVVLIILFFLIRIFSLIGFDSFGDTSGYGDTSSSYGAPSSSYGAPSSSYGAPSSSYGTPSSSYGTPSSSYGTPSSSYGAPSSSYGAPSSSYSNYLNAAKIQELYYLYPGAFSANDDENIGNIDLTQAQQNDYLARLLSVNQYNGQLQNQVNAQTQLNNANQGSIQYYTNVAPYQVTQ